MESLSFRNPGVFVTRLEGAVGQDAVDVQQNGLDGGGPPGDRIVPTARGLRVVAPGGRRNRRSPR